MAPSSTSTIMGDDIMTQLFPDVRRSATNESTQPGPNTMGAFRNEVQGALISNDASQQQQGPEGAGNGFLNAEYLRAAQLSDQDPLVEEFNQNYPVYQPAQQAAPLYFLPAPFVENFSQNYYPNYQRAQQAAAPTFAPAPFAPLPPPPAPVAHLHQNYQYDPRVPVQAAPPAPPPIPQVPQGRQRIVTAQEREAMRQLMIRRNRPQQPQPTAGQPWLKYPDDQMTIGLREFISRYRIGPLKRSHGADSFRTPLSAGIPRRMIQPMTLNKLGENLKNGYYYSLRDFMRDFYRIIEDCKATFREGHYLREDADSMEHYWEYKMSDLRLP